MVSLTTKTLWWKHNYGGGDYLSYRKAQIDVAREYGIPTDWPLQ